MKAYIKGLEMQMEILASSGEDIAGMQEQEIDEKLHEHTTAFFANNIQPTGTTSEITTNQVTDTANTPRKVHTETIGVQTTFKPSVFKTRSIVAFGHELPEFPKPAFPPKKHSRKSSALSSRGSERRKDQQKDQF